MAFVQRKWVERICSILLFVLLALPHRATAQEKPPINTLKIFGTVQSARDGMGIPYAHVYIAGGFTGTVTNEAGVFELKYSENEIGKEVTFSAIGFNTKTLPLDKNLTSPIEIRLEEVILQLDEVMVSANHLDSAQYIFETAVKFIKFNYPLKPHLMEGFFREISLKDTIYTRLIEAAVVIQEDGYNKEYFKERSLEETKSRTKVIELRKSDDLREYGLLNKLTASILGDRNELYMLLRNNYVRTFKTKVKNYLFSYDYIIQQDFVYEGKSMWEGNRVHVISVSIPQGFMSEKLVFYINPLDYAIIKIEHLSLPTAQNKISDELLIEGKYFSRREISFRKITNRYYPVFLHTIWPAYNTRPTAQVNGKTVRQHADILFLLTNVYEDSYSRIRWKNAEKQNKDLYDNNTPYNEVFWENYNTVKLNPLKREAKELEKQTPLSEQFKKNQK